VIISISIFDERTEREYEYDLNSLLRIKEMVLYRDGVFQREYVQREKERLIVSDYLSVI